MVLFFGGGRGVDLVVEIILCRFKFSLCILCIVVLMFCVIICIVFVKFVMGVMSKIIDVGLILYLLVISLIVFLGGRWLVFNFLIVIFDGK